MTKTLPPAANSRRFEDGLTAVHISRGAQA